MRNSSVSDSQRAARSQSVLEITAALPRWTPPVPQQSPKGLFCQTVNTRSKSSRQSETERPSGAISKSFVAATPLRQRVRPNPCHHTRLQVPQSASLVKPTSVAEIVTTAGPAVPMKSLAMRSASLPVNARVRSQ